MIWTAYHRPRHYLNAMIVIMTSCMLVSQGNAVNLKPLNVDRETPHLNQDHLYLCFPKMDGPKYTLVP